MRYFFSTRRVAKFITSTHKFRGGTLKLSTKAYFSTTPINNGPTAFEAVLLIRPPALRGVSDMRGVSDFQSSDKPVRILAGGKTQNWKLLLSS